MSTATKEIEDRADSEVASLRARVAALEDEIERLEAREEELEAEAVRQKGDAGDVDPDVREELAAVRSDREIAGTALEVKRRQLRKAEAEALREEARARLRSITKIAGGVGGEVPRRLEEARELKEKLVKRLSWLATRPELLRRLGVEADVLASAFDLERPVIRTVADFDENPAAAAKSMISEIKRETRRIRAAPGVTTREKVESLPGMFDVDTPTPELLERLEELDGDDGEG